MLGAASKNPDPILSSSGLILRGQTATDFLAESLSTRGRSIRDIDPVLWSQCWPKMLSKIEAALPRPPSLPHIVLPPKQNLIHAVCKKFNLKAAYGPDLTHNRHILMLDDKAADTLYRGLCRYAQGKVFLPQENCVAYIRLLFKSKNPLHNDRWRALVIFGHKYKLVEWLDFEAVRPIIEQRQHPSIQGFTQGCSTRTATDSTHADVDCCRMRGESRVYISMDLVQAFPRLLREIILAIYHQKITEGNPYKSLDEEH